jgi:signal peptidase I
MKVGRFFRRDKASEGRRGWLRGPRRKGKGALVEYLVIAIVAFVLVFGFIRPFVVKSFWIPSESMVPTLEVGDRLFVNRFVYRFTEPARGDIIVFDSPESEDELIKRVVAVPGDRVRVANGVLKLNGEFQEEPYVRPQFPDGSVYGPTKVPEGEVFVMGDNRGNSRDSRFIGTIPIESIQGEAFFRFWPPSRIGILGED